MISTNEITAAEEANIDNRNLNRNPRISLEDSKTTENAFSEVNLAEVNMNLPLKFGWLYKKTTGLASHWVRRYFVLENKELRYFYNEEEAKPAGFINFDLVTIETEVKGRKFKLKALGSKRVFKLRAGTPQAALDWIYSISLHLQESNGRKIILPIAKKKNFWKFDRVSEPQFLSMAATGDILLFRAKNITSKVQRFFTNSDYDHVALVVKFSSQRVGLFEVTGKDGVSLLFWDDFVSYDWHNLYSRLVYKKLNVERTESMLLALENFISSVKGMKYTISAKKLIRNKPDKLPSDKKGYFCSELIAAAYKEMGLLPEHPPASKYYPGHFADFSLPLQKNAMLLEGLLIDFDIK